jgi:hypothetical protein
MHGRRPAPRRPGRTRHWLLNRTVPDGCLDTGCLSANHGVSLGWLTARDALSVGRCMHPIRHPTALPRVTDTLASGEGMNPTRVDCRSRPRRRAEAAPPSVSMDVDSPRGSRPSCRRLSSSALPLAGGVPYDVHKGRRVGSPVLSVLLRVRRAAHLRGQSLGGHPPALSPCAPLDRCRDPGRGRARFCRSGQRGVRRNPDQPCLGCPTPTDDPSRRDRSLR